MVTELYKSTILVTCNFQFTRMFLFFNYHALLVVNNDYRANHKMSQVIHVELWYTGIIVTIRKSLIPDDREWEVADY